MRSEFPIRASRSRRQAALVRGLSLAVSVVLVSSVGVALPLAAQAAPVVAPPADSDWATISAKLAGITGVWTNETYSGAISDTMPDTALLGNGDVGVSSAGAPGVKTFVVSKGDFWNGAGTVRTAGLGGYTIKPVAPSTENLALNRDVAASSDPDGRASLAVNGQWALNSGYQGWYSAVGKPQWFRVDLGASTEIGRVVLRHESSARRAETARNPRIFSVQYSDAPVPPGDALDDPGWTTLHAFTDSTVGVTDFGFDAVTARWVRVFYTQPSQESTADTLNNPRAILGAFEIYRPVVTEDLARGAITTASSSHVWYEPYRAVNGEWAPNYEGWISALGMPQWLALDLGRQKTFDRYVIKGDGSTRPAYNSNNTRSWQLQTSADGIDWTTIDSVTGNTAAVAERVLVDPVTTQYVRVLVTEGVQPGQVDPRARITQFQLFDGPPEEVPVVAPFRETQNILDASIDTAMGMDGQPVTMHTWQGQDENVVVTEMALGVEASGPQEFELSLWAGAGSASSAYTNASGVDGQTLWATRQTGTSGTPRWVSRAALATRVLGATMEAPISSGATATGRFTLQPGQSVSIVTGVGGGGQNPTDHLSVAQDLAETQTQQTLADLEAAKTTWWEEYWQKSWVELGEPTLERYYYGAQYIIGSAARAGKLAPGLYGIWYTRDNAKWSGDMHLNYNFLAPFYGVYSSNRPETSLPVYDLIEDYVPEAQRRASTYSELRQIRASYVDARPELSGGADGVLFPVGIGPWGSTVYTTYHGQTADSLHSASLYVKYWEYTRDQQFLAEHLYPYLKEVAAFFEHWLDDGGIEGGQLNLWAAPHEGTWGRNSSPDVPLVRQSLKALVEASEILGQDVTQRAVWQDMLDRLAPTPTIIRNNQSVYALADANTGTFTTPFRPGDHIVNLEVISSADEVDIFSPEVDKQRGRDTLNQMGSWGQDNSFAKVFTQAARVGYDPILNMARLRNKINSQMKPNLRIADGAHGIEKSAATEAINNSLVWGDGERLRVFPGWPTTNNANWPTTTDASFHQLRTKGAFVVSASRTGNEVSAVEITAEAGGDVALTDPWGAQAATVQPANGPAETVDVVDGVISFATDVGETYTVAPIDSIVSVESPMVAGDPLVGQQLTASTGTWNLDGLTYSYHWTRDGAPIADATGAEYTLTAADRDHQIGVQVTAARSGFAAVTATAAAVGPVGGDGGPEVEVPLSPPMRVQGSSMRWSGRR